MARKSARNRRVEIREIAPTADGAIGAMVWWDLVNVHVRRDDLTELLRLEGLDPEEFLPPAQKPSVQFNKAVRRHMGSVRKGYRIEPYPEPSKGEIIYCVLRHDAEAATKTLSGSTVATITFDTVNNVISSEGSEGVVALIHDTFRAYVEGQIHTTEDVRKKIEDVLMGKLAGCRIRRSGPPYYVLAPYLPEVYKLRSVVEAIVAGGHADDAWLYVTPVHKGGDMGRKARRGFEDELAEIAAKLEEMRDSDKRTRKDTLERRLEEFNGLREKIGMFSAMLDFRKDDLEQATRDLDAIVMKMIEESDDDESEAAA